MDIEPGTIFSPDEEDHIIVKGIGLELGYLVSDLGSTHTSFVILSK